MDFALGTRCGSGDAEGSHVSSITIFRYCLCRSWRIIQSMAKRSDPFTVIVERDEEGYFIANVPELRGCHTQAKSLDVLMKRVAEAISLCLADGPRPPRRTFVAVQQVQIA
jgi:predicted RNase H-like HicB family nuclease